MAATRASFVTRVFCVAVAILFSSSFVSGQCKGRIQDLKICLPYVQKGGPKLLPSDACCHGILDIDILCVCHHLPPDIGKLISIEKVVFILKACGDPLDPGTKCGNYTVPPIIRPT